MIKTISKKKKCKKTKWLSEEALQIAEKRKDLKGKGEKERYPFECTVPKNSKESKKAFLSDKCKQIEENNRMGKTRDLFKKSENDKGISCKDGYNKGQKWYGSNRSRRY